MNAAGHNVKVVSIRRKAYKNSANSIAKLINYRK